MALVTATISGQLLRPDLGESASTVTIEAATDGGRITLPGLVIDGRIPVKIAPDGTASVTIPTTDQAGIEPADAFWKITKRNVAGTYVGYFQLTDDMTWDQIFETNDVPVSTLLGEVQAVAAAAAASAAEAAAITGLTTADAALAFLVADAGSLTQDALDARYVTATVVNGDVTLFLDGVEL